MLRSTAAPLALFFLSLGCGSERSAPSQRAEPDPAPRAVLRGGERPTQAGAPDEPSAAPADPAPVARLACDSLPAGTPIFALGRFHGSVYRIGRLRQGTLDDTARDVMPGWAELTRADVNGDELPDYLVLTGDVLDESSPSDSFEPHFTNYGEHSLGLMVSCDPRGHAILLLPAMRRGLRLGDAAVRSGGLRWRVVVETESQVGAEADVEGMMERGEPLFEEHAFLWTEEGYRARPGGSREAANRCTSARRAGDLDTAQLECDIALDVAASDSARGGILYELARVAEERGDTAAARTMYARSLQHRPNHEIVRARLDSLGEAARPEAADRRLIPVGATPADHAR